MRTTGAKTLPDGTPLDHRKRASGNAQLSRPNGETASVDPDVAEDIRFREETKAAMPAMPEPIADLTVEGQEFILAKGGKGGKGAGGGTQAAQEGVKVYQQ